MSFLHHSSPFASHPSFSSSYCPIRVPSYQLNSNSLNPSPLLSFEQPQQLKHLVLRDDDLNSPPNFNISPCFESSYLLLFPVLVYLVFGGWEWWRLSKREEKRKKEEGLTSSGNRHGNGVANGHASTSTSTTISISEPSTAVGSPSLNGNGCGSPSSSTWKSSCKPTISKDSQPNPLSQTAKSNRVLKAKLSLVVLLALVQLASVGLLIGEAIVWDRTERERWSLEWGWDVKPAMVVGILGVGSLILAFFHLPLSHTYLPHSSTPFLIFLLLLILHSLIHLKTILTNPSPSFTFFLNSSWTSNASHQIFDTLGLVDFVFTLVGLTTKIIVLGIESVGPEGRLKNLGWVIPLPVENLAKGIWKKLLFWRKGRGKRGDIRLPDDSDDEDGVNGKSNVNATSAIEDDDDDLDENGNGNSEFGKECPRTRANIFSRLTFTWLTPTMILGKKKYLEETDLWRLERDDQADMLHERIKRFWNSELERAKRINEGRKEKERLREIQGKKKRKNPPKEAKPRLAVALIKSHVWRFLRMMICKFISDALSFSQPLLLRLLLKSIESPSPYSTTQGYYISLLMLLFALTQTASLHQYFETAFESGMRVKGGLVGMVYEKGLKLSGEEKKGRATGDIVNLMATDSERLQDVMQWIVLVPSLSLQITLAFLFLYSIMGWPMFAGVAVMALSLPLNGILAKINSKFVFRQLQAKDKRTRLMSEILSNIRSVKLYAWESAFARRLFDIREKQELKTLRQQGYLQSGMSMTWNVIPFLVAFVSFAVYALTSPVPLTADVVFPALSLFQLMSFPFSMLPGVIAYLVEAAVSVRRLGALFQAKELQEDSVDIIEAPRGSLKTGDELVRLKEAEFKWNSETADPILHDISLSVKKGELVAIVGRVGSGKSSLISAVIGDMIRSEGKAMVRGKVAYASQLPWIMSCSVRDNILFGCRMEESFYDAVLEACALKEDLAILPQGDMTLVGEKGITLSGGQKARVALARAVYARADVYLFDDPLSALDAHIGRHVFEKVIGPNGMLSSKARLLCTNAIPFCEKADEIIMLRQGIILERGDFSSVMSRDSELSKLLVEFGKQQKDDDESQVNSEATLDVVSSHHQVDDTSEDAEVPMPAMLKVRQPSHFSIRRASVVSVKTQKKEAFRAMKRSTRSKEQRVKGNVGMRIYGKYLRANGTFFAVLFLVSMLGQESLKVITNLWLKHWATFDESHKPSSNDTRWFISIYFVFGIGTALTSGITGVLLYSVCVVRCARQMHDTMYQSVMRAPMSFFDLTPIGTILNRFSRDVDIIDTKMGRTLYGFVRCVIACLAMIIVIATAVPLFIPIVICLLFIYLQVQKYYLATSRELKRLDSISKSPIFESFQETLNGVSTIRAYRQQARFTAENEARLDRNLEAYFPSICCNRWLAVRLETLGSLIIFSSASLSVYYSKSSGRVDAGLTGLLMSFALNSTQSLNWIVRSATEVETNIVCVERCQQYIDITPEAPPIIPTARPKPDWPEEGSVVFDQVSLKYRPNLEPVLKNISFKIKKGMKVGVCGRTGAGKSTLTMALYRVVELCGGRILIDGVDISEIGLHDLRSRLSIIPQDAQCFDGTLRENLDPSLEATDAELWKVLEQARMKDHVQNMPGMLDAHVEEGGSNLSAGQRQLLCLARALLRRSKVLLLDEATSAVDPESDQKIQLVIREEFKNCTVITIAHRLNTIMDSDGILVLSGGEVVEWDSPEELLGKKDSIFYSLAQEAGLAK